MSEKLRRRFTDEDLAKEAEREVKQRRWVYSAHNTRDLTPQQSRQVQMMEEIALHFRELAGTPAKAPDLFAGGDKPS